MQLFELAEGSLMSEAAIPFCVPDGGTTLSAVSSPPTTCALGGPSASTRDVEDSVGGQKDGKGEGRQLLPEVLLFGILSTFLAQTDS